jgi:hypothetical protein
LSMILLKGMDLHGDTPVRTLRMKNYIVNYEMTAKTKDKSHKTKPIVV